MSQDFHGDVGQVTAGDINNNGVQINLDNPTFKVHQGKQLPPAGSDRERICPQCDKPTWRYTQLCMHCDYDLHRHDETVAREKEEERMRAFQQRLMIVFGGTFTAAMALLYVKQYLPEGLRSWAVGIAIGLGVIAFIAMKAGETPK
jgi:hypothetical protein